ncbi:MAG TPA: hypothetical protein VEY11_19565 [Pyrinomonadaceae bacterium]|nr:hypothetical protein [Pyrinomonadaceae bacterium]
MQSKIKHEVMLWVQYVLILFITLHVAFWTAVARANAQIIDSKDAATSIDASDMWLNESPYFYWLLFWFALLGTARLVIVAVILYYKRGGSEPKHSQLQTD